MNFLIHSLFKYLAANLKSGGFGAKIFGFLGEIIYYVYAPK